MPPDATPEPNDLLTLKQSLDECGFPRSRREFRAAVQMFISLTGREPVGVVLTTPQLEFYRRMPNVTAEWYPDPPLRPEQLPQTWVGVPASLGRHYRLY